MKKRNLRPSSRNLIALALALSLASVPVAEVLAKSHRKKAAKNPDAPVSAKKVTLVDPHAPLPVDEAIARLLKLRKAKKARTLARAYEFLQKEKLALALSTAAPLKNDATYGDDALWILAQAERAQARKDLEAGKSGPAAEAAKRSLGDLLQIESAFSWSPFNHLLGRELGLSELAQADALAATGKTAAARALYERGFHRLGGSAGMTHVLPMTLKSFAQACKPGAAASDASDYDPCALWLRRLGRFFPRHSPEYAAFGKQIPHGEKPKSIAYPRASTPYRAPDLDQAAFDASMALYLDEKWGAAAQSFQKALDDFPRSAYRYRIRYWLGEAQKMNKSDDYKKTLDELVTDAPLTYYGLLAAQDRGRNLDSLVSAELPIVNDREPALQPEDAVHLEKAEALLSAGASELAAYELREIKPSPAYSNEFMMYLAAVEYQARAYNPLFNVLSDLVQRGYPGVASTTGLRMIFPVAYHDLIKRAAAENSVDSILALSLIKQESAFDPNAISVSGALGLTQLMPATASDVDHAVLRSELNDPESNIGVGVAYIKTLVERFNGSFAMAIAAYNAGPAAVSRWVKAGAAKKGVREFIESIPYRETREYVSSIIRNYYWYAHRLGAPAPESIDFFWKSQTKPSPSAAPSPNPNPNPNDDDEEDSDDTASASAK